MKKKFQRRRKKKKPKKTPNKVSDYIWKISFVYFIPEEEIPTAFDIVTECAHELVTAGEYEIYSRTKEDLEKEIDLEKKKSVIDLPSINDNPNPIETKDEQKWEYKITETGVLYGPFKTSEMKYWVLNQYFDEKKNEIFVRKVSEDIFGDDEEKFVPLTSIKWDEMES